MVLLPSSPMEDASRRSRRAVRSFGCDHHRFTGFGGTLPAFNSRLALRVLLDRHWSAPCVSTGTRSPTFVFRQVLSRFIAATDPRPSRQVEDSVGAFQRACYPFGVLMHESQLPPELPPSGYRRRAQGLSPSPCLDGPLCVPGLVPSRTRPWGCLPSRAFTLYRAVTPFGALCPPDVRSPLPAPIRSPDARGNENRVLRVTRAFPRGRSSAVGRRPRSSACC